MKIAIVGLADNCLEGYDPNRWDRRYHMGQDLWAGTATDVFEAHERDHWGQGERLEYLTRTDARVWTREPQNDLPNCRPLPLWSMMVACQMTEPYFESTSAYMLGHAIWQKPDQIGIYGISGDDEYGQRPNIEYLIGVARASRIGVWVHPNSDFFSSQWRCGYYGKQDPIASSPRPRGTEEEAA